jgi:hypothetical protein
MLDMLDFAIVADKFMTKGTTILSRGEVYICVWAMLVPGSIIPNAPIDELENISMFLKEEGYYAKAGKRPKHFKAVVADLP